jgi:hypothetical protein
MAFDAAGLLRDILNIQLDVGVFHCRVESAPDFADSPKPVATTAYFNFMPKFPNAKPAASCQFCGGAIFDIFIGKNMMADDTIRY